MSHNPFSLGGTDIPLCDRQTELQALIRHAHNAQNVLIYGSRRLGNMSRCTKKPVGPIYLKPDKQSELFDCLTDRGENFLEAWRKFLCNMQKYLKN